MNRAIKKVQTQRPILKTLLTFILCLGISACNTNQETQKLAERSRQTPAWFDSAKLGIFIHWGLPSVPAYASGKPFQDGELEQLLINGKFPDNVPYSEWYQFSMTDPNSDTYRWHGENYGVDTPYEAFKPTFEKDVDNWDPNVWAELFSSVGAEYVVLVTKHHDGYTLWPSDVKNPQKSNWTSERDLVGELATAVRAKGMRFGAYYSSGLDWSFNLPINDDNFVRFLQAPPTSEAYGAYAHDHIRELIDRYQPDLIWSDIGYPSNGELNKLLSYYFETVPEGVVNDRWSEVDIMARIANFPGGTWLAKKLMATIAAEGHEDQLAPHEGIGYMTAEYANLPGIHPNKWESTRGIGGSFAYNQQETEKDMLSGDELIHFLIDTVSKNGNILINVGPDSFGDIPHMQRQPLLEMGDWLKVNGKAIFDTRPWKTYGAETESGGKIRFTQDKDFLYAIVLDDNTTELTLTNLDFVPREIRLLGGGDVSHQNDKGRLMIKLASNPANKTPARVLQISKP